MRATAHGCSDMGSSSAGAWAGRTRSKCRMLSCRQNCGIERRHSGRPMNASGTRLEQLLSAFLELASQPEWTDSQSASWYRHGEVMLDTLVSELIEPVLDRAVAAGDHDFVAR